jgi:hypothetical protein
MVRQHEERDRGAEGPEKRPSRSLADGARGSAPSRGEKDTDAVTSRVILREQAGRAETRGRSVEREPMARVVDPVAWREERPRASGERESTVPTPRERD